MAPRTVALYLVGGLLAYAAAHGAGLVSDDFLMLESLRGGASSIIWAEHQGGFLRPVTVATFWLDLRLHGGAPAWMHVENVLLHAVCACLVHALASRVRAELDLEHRWLAPAAGLLFLVHPSHAEVVAWISGRGDLLATALSLAGIVLGVDYLRQGRPARAAWAAAAWAAAVFAKESALAAPGMFAALGLLSFHGPRRRLAVMLGAGASAIAACFVARVAVFGGFFASSESRHRLDIGAFEEWSVLKRQALRTFVPALVPGDGVTLGVSVATLFLLGSTIVAFAWTVVRQRARYRPFACVLGLIAAYLCSLVPVVGSTVQIVSGEGERFVYLGSAMAMLGVATALAGAGLERPARYAAAAWILAYSVLLVPAVARWRTAGLFASRIVQTLVRESHGPEPLILNLPDSVEGAYVFRNGLEAAVRAQRDLDVGVVATFTADREGGGAEAVESSARPDSWELRFTRRMPHSYPRSPALVERVETDGGTRIATVELSSFSDVFVFRGGELQRVGPRSSD